MANTPDDERPLRLRLLELVERVVGDGGPLGWLDAFGAVYASLRELGARGPFTLVVHGSLAGLAVKRRVLLNLEPFADGSLDRLPPGLLAVVLTTRVEGVQVEDKHGAILASAWRAGSEPT